MPSQLSQLFAQVKETLNGSGVEGPLQASISLYFDNLGTLKALAVILTVFFVASTIFFMLKTGWLQLKVDRVRDTVLKVNLPKKRSIKAWRQIQRHFFAGDENDLKLALIEADTTLDEALRIAGFHGINLGERLKKITTAQIPNLDDVWEAHKLRNRLVHEAGFKLSRDTAERALTIYEKTFRDLGLLD